MALENAPITSAPKEKIPFLVREAAKFVGVGDFIKIKWQASEGNLSSFVHRQIDAVGWAIAAKAAEKGKNYSPDLELDPPAHFQEWISRKILADVSLPTYLAARQGFLETARKRNTRLAKEYEVMGGYGLEALLSMGQNLSADFDLTKAAAVAANINLTP